MSMVDIGEKQITKRVAQAEGKVIFTPQAYKILLKQGSPKGNIFETAKIAGIMAAKNTPVLIPLCHPLSLEKVSVSIEHLKSKNTVRVTSEVRCSGKTGVEMEALSAVSAACLTIYDMMKFTGQDITITDIRLMHKSGGKSGDYMKKILLMIILLSTFLVPHAWAQTTQYPDPNRVTMWNKMTDSIHTMGQTPQKAAQTRMKLRYQRSMARLKAINKAKQYQLQHEHYHST